jgi:hypothetical protein
MPFRGEGWIYVTSSFIAGTLMNDITQYEMLIRPKVVFEILDALESNNKKVKISLLQAMEAHRVAKG